MASPRKKIVSIGVKTPYPGFIEPLLAEQVDRVPQGDRWLHEIKYDGYRAQLHIIGESIKVFTRRGYDWTRQFRKVEQDALLIRANSAIIDGEIVVPGEGGKTDFSQLQNSVVSSALTDERCNGHPNVCHVVLSRRRWLPKLSRTRSRQKWTSRLGDRAAKQQSPTLRMTSEPYFLRKSVYHTKSFCLFMFPEGGRCINGARIAALMS